MPRTHHRPDTRCTRNTICKSDASVQMQTLLVTKWKRLIHSHWLRRRGLPPNPVLACVTVTSPLTGKDEVVLESCGRLRPEEAERARRRPVRALPPWAPLGSCHVVWTGQQTLSLDVTLQGFLCIDLESSISLWVWSCQSVKLRFKAKDRTITPSEDRDPRV